jgi:hypothetical protein
MHAHFTIQLFLRWLQQLSEISHPSGTPGTAAAILWASAKQSALSVNLKPRYGVTTMTTLNLNDLTLSQALDRKSMTELTGAGDWHLRSSFISTGSWSGYTQMFSSYVGQTFHDGYLSRQTYEGWKRTRTETEYSYWDHFVRV